MAQQAIRARAAAIDGFAAVLRELRDSVGTPSFREMAGRSRAISHTTLHEAAQGNRLPSWATTVEFVKACGADASEYRDRWEHADRTVRSVTVPDRAPDGNAGYAPTDDAPFDVARPIASDRDPATTSSSGRSRRRYVVPALVAAVVVAAAGITIGIRSASSDDVRGRSGPAANAQLSAANCPVSQVNPPSAPPATRGDAGAFITDVTLPDCSHIHRGAAVTKTWRFKNVGKVPWVGYSLHRLDQPQRRDQCQTISDLPIATTRPGQQVDIKTEITAPESPTFCFVRFKMVNASGKIAFPGSRPVYFQLIVG